MPKYADVYSVTEENHNANESPVNDGLTRQISDFAKCINLRLPHLFIVKRSFISSKTTVASCPPVVRRVQRLRSRFFRRIVLRCKRMFFPSPSRSVLRTLRFLILLSVLGMLGLATPLSTHIFLCLEHAKHVWHTPNVRHPLRSLYAV